MITPPSGNRLNLSYFRDRKQVLTCAATLDHLTAGRVGWNVVTSLNDTEAQNFGMETVLKYDLRYEQADELMDLVYGLWDT